MADLQFTIIIPTLNEEEYISRLLSALENQIVQNFEVIVSDGESEDTTKEKVLAFSKKFPLRFIASTKRQISHQRNFGATHAQGNYLIFMDADTYVEPDFTKRLTQFMAEKKALVYLPFIMTTDPSWGTKLYFTFYNWFFTCANAVGLPISSGGCQVWERTFFLRVGGFDEELYISEDHQMVITAKKWGVKAQPVRSAKVEFSLRRVKRQGIWWSFYEGLVVTFCAFFRIRITKPIYRYEMGGHMYKKDAPKFHS